MNDDTIADLKQFIATTVRQEVTDVVKQELSETNKKIDDLSNKMDDGFAGVGDAVHGIHDSFDDHENRITKLETKTI